MMIIQSHSPPASGLDFGSLSRRISRLLAREGKWELPELLWSNLCRGAALFTLEWAPQIGRTGDLQIA